MKNFLEKVHRMQKKYLALNIEWCRNSSKKKKAMLFESRKKEFQWLQDIHLFKQIWLL